MNKDIILTNISYWDNGEFIIPYYCSDYISSACGNKYHGIIIGNIESSFWFQFYVYGL